MSFLLKRRLNPFLLLITVISLSLLAGLSITYQTQLDGATSDHQDLQENLTETKAELEEAETNLTILEDENEVLDDQASGFNEDLADAESQVESLQNDIDVLNQDISSLEDERDSYKSNFEDIESDLAQICNEEDLDEGSEAICEAWNE